MSFHKRASVIMGAIAIFSTSSAVAETGFYIAGGLNATTSEHSVNRNTLTNEPNTGPAGGPSISTSDKDTGASVYVGAGYRFDLPRNNYFEVEAYYADETAETQNLNNVLVTDIELTNSYGVDAHFGHQVTDNFSVYGLIGIVQYEGDIAKSYTFAPPIDAVDLEETGFVYGGGAQVRLTDKLSTFGEIRITNDLEFDVPADRGGIISDNELELTTFRTGLKYQF